MLRDRERVLYNKFSARDTSNLRESRHLNSLSIKCVNSVVIIGVQLVTQHATLQFSTSVVMSTWWIYQIFLIRTPENL